MHQPYYRSALTGGFQMPWARLHALKDYLDMVEILTEYPSLRQTFNLVPSLVEQLEDYASGDFVDLYWEHTTRPAADLSPAERAFVVERMCERPDHPRAKSHPRYLELAHKREAGAHQGWAACSASFTVDELRDLQIWFNLAWFDPTLLETEPLLGLVRRGSGYTEDDKLVLAQVQGEILARVIPAYRLAAGRGQIELSTSPYFHPILPLLTNSDSARVAAGETVLPRRRFAHPEDAQEQVDRGMAKHEEVFGSRPRGLWCSEQAIGEEVLPLLMRSGAAWTISDQQVLLRSIQGTAVGSGNGSVTADFYRPYRLEREHGEISVIFRDHTLSDLIGFAYQSWDSRDAAADLLRRLHDIAAVARRSTGDEVPLVTVALDGENAWEYYPRDGRDFLRHLYDGLEANPSFRCVTVSEHLDRCPPTAALDWLHTGSWIGGDLRTWSGDPGHNRAWGALHDARDLAAVRRIAEPADVGVGGQPGDGVRPNGAGSAGDDAWRHVLVAEGSDWFWWFGEHHRTELDHVWDEEFRYHLQQVYRLLGEPVPGRLMLPLLGADLSVQTSWPVGPIKPIIDGRLTDEDGWDAAALLTPEYPSTMQRAEGPHIIEVRAGWDSQHLYLLLIPRSTADLAGLELELEAIPPDGEGGSAVKMTLTAGGQVEICCSRCGRLMGTGEGAWSEVVEVALTLAPPALTADERWALILRVGHGGMTDHVFRSIGSLRSEGP
jgi:alpha-amylase/alpha-mannosidase (GH57 family)